MFAVCWRVHVLTLRGHSAINTQNGYSEGVGGLVVSNELLGRVSGSMHYAESSHQFFLP